MAREGDETEPRSGVVSRRITRSQTVGDGGGTPSKNAPSLNLAPEKEGELRSGVVSRRITRSQTFRDGGGTPSKNNPSENLSPEKEGEHRSVVVSGRITRSRTFGDGGGTPSKNTPSQKLSPEKEGEHRSGVVSGRGKRKTAMDWYRNKLEAMSLHFKAVAFPPPGKRLDIGAHASLLVRLGLWEFVNLNFDQTIREALIKELVLCFESQSKSGRTRVNGVPIYLNRTALGSALHLPLKRDSTAGELLVSKEQAFFIEDFIWGFLVLRDDDEDAALRSHPYMLGFSEALRERRFYTIDWAGLVWFMALRELKRGVNLRNCHYAPHLQLLLKHKRPDWFGACLESGKSQSILTQCCKRKREWRMGSCQRETEAEFGASGEAHYEDQNGMMEDGAKLNAVELQGDEVGDGGACDTNSEMYAAVADYLNEEEENEAEFEANVGESVGVHCVKKDDVLPLNEQEAAFEANHGSSLGFCGSKEGMREDKVDISDSLSEEVNVVQEAHDKEVRIEGSTEGFKSREIEDQAVHTGSCLENSGDEIILEIPKEEDKQLIIQNIADEPFGGNELSLMQRKNEGNISDFLGYKEQTSHEVEPVQIDISSDDERHNAFLERGEGSGMSGIAGISVGQFAIGNDAAGCNFAMTAQYGHGEDTLHLEKSRDPDHCAENVNFWVEACNEGDTINVMLQKKFEEQNDIIRKYQSAVQKEQQENQQYEQMLQMVRQAKQKMVYNYERELSLTNSTVLGYQKSTEKIKTSFAKYKEREELRREQDEQNGSHLAIKAMLEDFEKEWKSKLEEQLAILEAYCNRLGELEHGVNTMRGRRGI